MGIGLDPGVHMRTTTMDTMIFVNALISEDLLPLTEVVLCALGEPTRGAESGALACGPTLSARRPILEQV